MPGTSDAVDEDLQVAMTLKSIRSARSLTLTQVSERSGVSVGHLSRIENAERMPTVRVLMQLARVYGVSISDLVGEADDESGFYVSVAENRRKVELPEAALTPLSDPKSPVLQAFELQLAPGRRGESTTHPGEEWIRVLAGAIELVVGGSTKTLHVGDVAQFSANQPHFLNNATDELAIALIVSATGTITAAAEH